MTDSLLQQGYPEQNSFSQLQVKKHIVTEQAGLLREQSALLKQPGFGGLDHEGVSHYKFEVPKERAQRGKTLKRSAGITQTMAQEGATLQCCGQSPSFISRFVCLFVVVIWTTGWGAG